MSKGSDMRAVFKYLQGFGFWEAAALLSVPRISSVTIKVTCTIVLVMSCLGPFAAPCPD